MTYFERGNTEDDEDISGVSENEDTYSSAPTRAHSFYSDSDSTAAAFRTARELLVDRAEAEKALELLEERKRQLGELWQPWETADKTPFAFGEEEAENI